MKIPVMTSSVDEWLDEKKKTDGAEGVWRINDKLYDFTLWSRIHPGGKFWLDVSRGTDITEAFEVHHFSNEVETVLQKYYLRDAATPRTASTTFDENGFYKAFKRKVRQQQLATNSKPSFAYLLISDILAVGVFLTGLLGAEYGVTWTIISGILLGLLSTSCHSFLYTNNWRVNYFNLSLMSSREWKISHVLGHHQYRGTGLDLESTTWQSLFKTGNKNLQLKLNFLQFPIAAHIQFLRRCLDVILSRKLRFNNEEMVAFAVPLFLFIAGVQPWKIFVKWNLTVLIGSFVFSFLNFTKYQTHINFGEDTKRQDFGIVQLNLTRTSPKENQSVISFLNSFRGNVLHYLCPSINCGSLSKLIPVFEETMNEFGLSYEKSSESSLEALQNRMPQGHVFFS